MIKICISVTSHALCPTVTNCHTFSDPLPLERDVLYGWPQTYPPINPFERMRCANSFLYLSANQTSNNVSITLFQIDLQTVEHRVEQIIFQIYPPRIVLTDLPASWERNSLVVRAQVT